MPVKLQIENVNVKALIPYARNSRTHSDNQVGQIAASIQEFGFINPILLGKDNVIIAGHGRLMAAQKLGLESVPVIFLEHLNENQRRALVIADNKIAENAGWDEDMLRLELEALRDADFNLDIMGFDADVLEALLLNEDDESGGGLTEDDAAPAVQDNTISSFGDVWILGRHRLFCGSSTEMSAIEKVMAGCLADMVFTDPPYNVNYGNDFRNNYRKRKESKVRPQSTIMNDNLGEDFPKFLQDVCAGLLSVCKGAIYICMSSSEMETLNKAFLQSGGKISCHIIWAKNHFVLGGRDYHPQYEAILYGWKDGNTHYWCGDRNQSDVWMEKRLMKCDLHPTMKPVALVERAIKNSSKTGDIVLDAFGGSGTTLIAAEKTGRSARIIELDPKYVDVIVRRWQDYTGLEAVREEDGLSFNALAQLTPPPAHMVGGAVA